MSDTEEPEDRPTEGVRIIGAQEAAEAAARPDVVRRRSRREKRYGDRPDRPEAASDLPKITISTSETEGPSDADRYAPEPVVRPGSEAAEGEPRWADDPDEAPEGDPRSYHGHARIVEAEDVPEEGDEPVDDWGPPASSGPGGAQPDDEPSVSWVGGDEELVDELGEPAPSGRWVEPAGSESEFAQAWREETDEPDAPALYGEVDEPTEQWSGEGLSAWDDEPSRSPVEPAWEPGRSEFSTFDPAVADAEADSDDSFVLPHWTEPPTGQVPKVVVGEDAPEPESLATYGSQPRWRDEGERDVVAGFDDLVDEGPGLGALGAERSVEDDFFTDGDYEDDLYYDEEYDEDDGYDELDEAPPARRRRVPTRRAPRERDLDDGGSVGGDRDLVTAVGVGVGLVAVGLICFMLGAVTTTILATVVVTVAAWEYFSAIRSAGHNPATLLGMASVIGLMVAGYTSGLAAYPVVLGLSVVAGLLWYLWVAPGEGAVQNLGLTMLGVGWIGVLGSFATLFLGLGRVMEGADASIVSNPGIGVLIAAVIAAVSHDVGAYFVGRFVGRTPLSAASPNKTQEGLVGGVLTSLVVTVLVVGIVGIDPIGADLAQTFVFALLCAIIAPLGDLAESFVKRDLAVKDMGSVLPGHGGVLDRFDGMLFVLPVAYFVTLLFDIWTGVGS